MSKRVSLADATARKKEEFVLSGPPLSTPKPRGLGSGRGGSTHL